MWFTLLPRFWEMFSSQMGGDTEAVTYGPRLATTSPPSRGWAVTREVTGSFLDCQWSRPEKCSKFIIHVHSVSYRNWGIKTRKSSVSYLLNEGNPLA